MERKLIQDWRLYCKEFKSPMSFIDMSFYSLIAAALQRRVWLTSTETPIFGNMFIILVGPPATGKGLVTTPYRDILDELLLFKEPKHAEATKGDNYESATEEDLLAIAKQLKEEIADLKNEEPSTPKEPPKLIPLAANSTTLAALLKENAKAVGSMKVAPCPLAPTGLYLHNSLTFHLDELEHLLKKDSEQLVQYLIQGWDCKKFVNGTKHNGTDIIRAPCLNMLAGTNFGFLEECHKYRLITGGLSSRMLFVTETKPRFPKFAIPQATEEQLEAKERIKKRVEYLAKTFFGQANWTLEAWDFLTDYFENNPESKRVNRNHSLDYYYDRKNLHVQKLALAIHFADYDEMTLGIEDAKEALQVLESLERKMHLALDAPEEDNTIGRLARRILAILEKGAKTNKQLYVSVDGHDKYKDAVSYLINTGQIEETSVMVDGQQKPVYRKVSNI